MLYNYIWRERENSEEVLRSWPWSPVSQGKQLMHKQWWDYVTKSSVIRALVWLKPFKCLSHENLYATLVSISSSKLVWKWDRNKPQNVLFYNKSSAWSSSCIHMMIIPCFWTDWHLPRCSWKAERNNSSFTGGRMGIWKTRRQTKLEFFSIHL